MAKPQQNQAEKGSAVEVDIQDQELCHYILSFNIEYLANTLNYSQLDSPGPCPNTDPIGDGLGANDTLGTAIRIPSLRITLVIVEDIGERQERTIQKVMWIPQG